VNVGAVTEVSPKLKPAGSEEVVDVSAEAPQINTTSSDFAPVVDQTQISNLPINGGRWSSFAILTPGVVSDSSGFGLLSFRGMSTLLNNNTVDGADNNQAFFSEERGRTRIGYSTPQAATIHGQRQVLCVTRQGLVDLNPTNGIVNFSLWFRSRLNDSVNAMSPIVVDDLVFISGAYYKVGSVLLRINPDHHSFEEVWRSTVLEIHWNTPIYHDGYLYAFSGRNEPDARFRCVELATGALKWDRAEGWPNAGHAKLEAGEAPPNVFGRASLILADGKLLVLGEAGLLGLFKPDPAKIVELSRWQVPKLQYPCWAGPVLCEKRLYLRDEEHLVCYEIAGNAR
jgi:hypothetical protein